MENNSANFGGEGRILPVELSCEISRDLIGASRSRSRPNFTKTSQNLGRAHHADTPRFVLSRAFDEPNVTYQGSLTPPTLGLALTLALTLTSALTLALTLTTDPSPDQAR